MSFPDLDAIGMSPFSTEVLAHRVSATFELTWSGMTHMHKFDRLASGERFMLQTLTLDPSRKLQQGEGGGEVSIYIASTCYFNARGIKRFRPHAKFCPVSDPRKFDEPFLTVQYPADWGVQVRGVELLLEPCSWFVEVVGWLMRPSPHIAKGTL